MAVSHRQT